MRRIRTIIWRMKRRNEGINLNQPVNINSQWVKQPFSFVQAAGKQLSRVKKKRKRKTCRKTLQIWSQKNSRRGSSRCPKNSGILLSCRKNKSASKAFLKSLPMCFKSTKRFKIYWFILLYYYTFAKIPHGDWIVGAPKNVETYNEIIDSSLRIRAAYQMALGTLLVGPQRCKNHRQSWVMHHPFVTGFQGVDIFWPHGGPALWTRFPSQIFSWKFVVVILDSSKECDWMSPHFTSLSNLWRIYDKWEKWMAASMLSHGFTTSLFCMKSLRPKTDMRSWHL